jgi:thiamine pyrophosphate-dependent acetolactate synthase large subunit-like protein
VQRVAIAFVTAFRCPIVEALHIASIGLPGPVLVDVPKDILH